MLPNDYYQSPPRKFKNVAGIDQGSKNMKTNNKNFRIFNTIFSALRILGGMDVSNIAHNPM